MVIDMLINDGQSYISPCLADDITLELERTGTPGKLTFTVLKDENTSFNEGNAVSFRVDNKDVFYGYIFSKKRSKDGKINITAYDQLRYLKNKDTIVYSNKTATELIKMIANDFRMQYGALDDTVYKIGVKKKRVEENTTLFDMIAYALDETLIYRRKMYVLYDDFGKLTLKDVEDMKLDILIDSETGENFDYTTSIDNQTYNVIKLAYEHDKTGKIDFYQEQHGENINRWGVLQLYEKINNVSNAKYQAEAMLRYYNRVFRNLSITNAFGDTRVRAGSSLGVVLNLGDMILQNRMLVEKVKHTFKNEEHKMVLTLRGGDFIAR